MPYASWRARSIAAPAIAAAIVTSGLPRSAGRGVSDRLAAHVPGRVLLYRALPVDCERVVPVDTRSARPLRVSARTAFGRAGVARRQCARCVSDCAVGGVLAVALAAVPAYVLAGRVGLAERGRIAAAIFAVVLPDLVYGGLLLSEPFAYPLFLTAVLVGVDAIAAPSHRRQMVFLVVYLLLVFARTQFAPLLIAYFVASWVCSRRLSPRRALSEQLLVVGFIALACALVAVVGPGRRGWHLQRHSSVRPTSRSSSSLVRP